MKYMFNLQVLQFFSSFKRSYILTANRKLFSAEKLANYSKTMEPFGEYFIHMYTNM